ncbi:MAG: hypothetical protein BGO67_11650 [Alphaproteobacteria bacterium 41-28]|nr:MAG: hypothetical protein BGO67_11650 [Alphaproteobacteria bacterium 41-28]
MQRNEIFLPQEIYTECLEIINGVKFTRREIDIIAFLVSGRSAKKISSFLSISPKTVDFHTHNIMQKLGCNSRESIIDFIEKSEKLPFVRKYHSSLLLYEAFEKSIRDISKLTQSESLYYLTIFWSEEGQKSDFFNFLATCLKSVGFNVSIRLHKKQQSIPKIINTFRKEEYIIYVVPKISDFQPLEANNRVLFLFLEEEDIKDIGQRLVNPNFMYLLKQKNVYFLIFEILKKVLPSENLEKNILEFEKQYNILQVSVIVKQTESFPNKQGLEKKEINLIYKLDYLLKNRKWRVGLASVFIFILSLVIVVTQYYWQEPLQGSSIRSDLMLPTKSVLLDRSNLIAQINEKFKGRGGIQTIALAGIGGSGKTTLARQYAQFQRSPIIWEFNAETPESLFNSFESLASALSKKEEYKKILREVNAIKNPTEREEKIIQFIKERLRSYSNWFLIYDNIETFKDIQQYLPQDPHAWGEGKIILTTRNSNIQVKDIIPIQELNQNQMSNLFFNIVEDGNTQQLTPAQKVEAKQFLRRIPPFPLDVLIAAYYLKATGTSYYKYLENINKFNKDFEVMQVNFVKEISDYKKTRYSLIKMSLQKIMSIHKDFGELLVAVSLLDSQNIPRDLLDAYKGNIIVDKFIYNLKKYSLITDGGFTSFNSIPVFSIHRSTQAISLDYLKKQLSLKKNNQLLDAIFKALQNYIIQSINEDDLQKMKLLVSHCETFLSHKELLSYVIKGSFNGELGRIYYYLSDYIKSKKYLEKSITYLNIKNCKDFDLLANILVCLGIVHWELGEHQKAKKVLEEALLFYKDDSAENQIGFARALAYLGVVYGGIGDHKKAKNLLNHSLFIYKKYFPKNYTEIAWTLAHLGNVYIREGNYEKAKNLAEQSFFVYKNYIPKSHPGAAWALTYLGIANRNLGDYEKAKNLFEQGLLIYKNHFSDNHIDVAWTLGQLGITYQKLGNYKKAKEVLSRSLNIHTNLLGYNNIRTSSERIKLGDIYKEAGDFKTAKNLLEEGLRAYENHYGDSHIKTAQVLRKVGEIYFLEGNMELAEHLMRRAFKIFQKNKHCDIYLILEDLGRLYLKKSILTAHGKNKKRSQKLKILALNYLKQALEIAKSHFPANSPHVTRLQNKIRSFSE